MLFNSPEFLFGFLPLVLAVFYLLGRSSYSAALNWLALSSLFFYGWWNPRYLLLIGASIVVNYAVGTAILKSSGSRRKILLIAGVVANLGCISYFKYAGFLSANLNALFGTEFTTGDIILPLAISFFTFQQIAFLVDTYQGKVQENHFSRYGLFVLFFPQLIAGPIVHHSEMMPQFTRTSSAGELAHNLNRGVTVFAIGLFKKIVIADSLAQIANPVFAMAEAGQALTTGDAWAGALAYTFQLYFDFSGYSDMALGLAIMFGIRLPLNFYSPYRARSIIEFWRRWHMTLSRFLRDYLYIPLGGNRHGKGRRHLNLLITMLLGGLWHGAGWTFVIWGGLHGLYLVINHGWRALLRKLQLPWLVRGNNLLAPALTFFCVVVAWVYFRAPTLDGAHLVLGAMFGVSDSVMWRFSDELVQALHIYPAAQFLDPVLDNSAAVALLMSLGASAFIVFCMPNTVEFMGVEHPALDATVPDTEGRGGIGLRWRASAGWALAIAALLVICITHGAMLSPFLYFQF